MEFITLRDNLQPYATIDNYESLIWTERYSEAGDFEIKSSDISYLMKMLPIESPTNGPTYVSLRDSTVPMVVETHKIEKKKGAAPTITITGRSFEACALERRVSVRDAPPAAKTTWLINAAKESDAAYEAMRVVLGDSSRAQGGVEVLPAIAPVVAEDAIPEIDLTLPADYNAVLWSSTSSYVVGDIVYYSGTVYKAIASSLNVTPPNATYWSVLDSGTVTTGSSNLYEIKADVLYNTVLDLIATNHHGIKSVRYNTNFGKFSVEIYNGADRTADVVFDARFDQIDNANYLLSMQGSTNVAYVYRGAVSGVAGSTAGSDKVLKNVGIEPTGMARRVLLLDLTSDNTVVSSDVSKTRGLIELYKNNTTALFDGEVAEQVSVGYNTAYFLGDIIKLQGEYGLYQNVRVVEFIRTSDASGMKAYPTFEAVDS